MKIKNYPLFTINYQLNLVSRVGFEPTIPRLKGACLKPDLATDRYDLGFGIWDFGFISISNPKS